MKKNTFVPKMLGGMILAAIAFTAVSSQAGVQDTTAQPATKRQPARVIFVPVTGSLIPQRVVIGGQEVNSASPLYVIQGSNPVRSGATSVGGLINLCPDIRTAPPIRR